MTRPLLVSDHGIEAAGLLERVRPLLPTGAPVFLDVPTNPTEEATLAALLAGKGLRPALHHLKRTRPFPPAMDPCLQLAPAPRQLKRKHTHQPPQSPRGLIAGPLKLYPVAGLD